MRNVYLFLVIFCLSPLFSFAQKKPLDHTVYDAWQHIGDQVVSANGKWIVYTVDPQEGDNELFIRSVDGNYSQSIPRGYQPVITRDCRFLVCRIKAPYADTRKARIKKVKPDDMPKDSIAIIELGKNDIYSRARLKSFKTPQKGSGWVAYQLEKSPEITSRKPTEYLTNKKNTDSLQRVIDSLENIIRAIPERKRKVRDTDDDMDAVSFADGDESPSDAGSDLVVRDLVTGNESTYNNVLEYFFSSNGKKLLMEQARNPKDSLSRAKIILVDLSNNSSKVLSNSGNDFKNFVFSEDGEQVAYVAERDARPKELVKYYKLWYYRSGMDSAIMLVDKQSVNMNLGMTISEFATLGFSKTGNRLLFGVAPLPQPKDTSFVDFDHPKMDLWHYKDDYLQTVQLYPTRLRAAQQESYLTIYDFAANNFCQIGSKELANVIPTNEGDGDTFYAISDMGKRVASQWLGTTLKDIYAVDVHSGARTLLKENLSGQTYVSPTGKFIAWYDRKQKNYFTWDGISVKNITANLKSPLWIYDWDTPDDPNAYGIAGWEENDAAIYINDRFNVWSVDPSAQRAPYILNKYNGERKNVRVRYIRTNTDERFIRKNQPMLFTAFDEDTKDIAFTGRNWPGFEGQPVFKPVMFGGITVADSARVLVYTSENFQQPGDLYAMDFSKSGNISATKLSSINPQQAQYNWGTAELYHWKAYNGKPATGILYKPEDFDITKKYPVIFYFYEKISDQLHDYKEPAPIRSAVNIPFFVSRGYLVFVPDISYTTGHPGRNAYDYIVSGARALAKNKWADSTRMALQGHSWGGYQVAQVATMTNLFKAYWAGAPVANMTSAYGGIRWESGVSRQFQYEKTQSRIGGSLWDNLPLYIENSPLFHLNKVTAPMVIMANDADGAVPWYQGIELFTALRRLGKQTWMFNYNGQGHGLTQRQDMRDYQIRMQQFFDWILKGEKPARWITDGIPAINKGRDFGLDVVE